MVENVFAFKDNIELLVCWFLSLSNEVISMHPTLDFLFICIYLRQDNYYTTQVNLALVCDYLNLPSAVIIGMSNLLDLFILLFIM